MGGNIILIGMMGAGKTAVGTELARMLGWPFVDSDVEIERAAAMSIPEIFARDGEPFFRERESQVIARLLAGGPMVLATGGGAWMRAENRATIRERGVAVWLDVELDTLWQRVRHRGGRPLLATPDPYGTLATLLDARRPVYARADIAVAVGAGDSLPDTVRRVHGAIAARRPEALTLTRER